MTAKIRRAFDSLQEALDAFAMSNRFGFLRGLQVGRLIGEENSFGGINELTCERLVELGAEGVRASWKLSAQQVEGLAALITALGNGVPGEGASEGGSAAEPAKQASTDVMFNSIQVELDLRKRLNEVRQHPNFHAFRDAALGSFWLEEWPRAPFEEALTVGQLVEMDVALLFKKRTTSGARAHYVTKALENALRASRLDKPAAPPVFAAPRTAASPPPSPARHPWITWGAGEDVGDDPAILSLVEAYVAATAPQALEAGSISGVMSDLPAHLSREEFLLVLGDQALPAKVSAQLGKWIKQHEHAPCVALMREALQTPGSRLSSLARIVSGDGTYTAFSGVAAIVLARALKAEPVRFGTHTCRGVWSLNPALIALVIGEAKRRKPRDTSRFIKELCPALDPFLQSWICEVVGSGTQQKRRRKGK